MNFEIAIQYRKDIAWHSHHCVNDLANNEVVIWKIDSRKFAEIFPYGKTILDPIEIDQARRFHQSKDAYLFLTSKIALRILAGHYLKRSPKHIRFKKGGFSKPYLVTDFPTLYFNVSHSGNLILIAFCLSEVGIDLEHLNPKFDIHSVLNAVFTNEEKSYICQNKYDSQRRFYLLWTRKECLLKQTGRGLIDHMNLISVLDGQHIDLQDHLNVQQNLQILSFGLAKRYIASLCVGQPIKNIHCNDFLLSQFIF